MPSTLEQLAAEVRELSPQDRMKLLALMIRELDRAEDAASSEEIEQAWDCEIQRRIEDLDSGRVNTIPAEEVFSRIHSKLDEAG